MTKKISVWLKGGGKLIKELKTENTNYIETQFDAYASGNPITNILVLDNCRVNFADISAIDIEEKNQSYKEYIDAKRSAHEYKEVY